MKYILKPTHLWSEYAFTRSGKIIRWSVGDCDLDLDRENKRDIFVWQTNLKISFCHYTKISKDLICERIEK